VLNRLLFKPISRVMADRQEKITGWEEKTRDLRETSRLRLEGYENQLREGKIQARERQEQLTKELKEHEEKNLRAVSEEAATLVASTKKALQEETERLRGELRRQAAELSEMLAEKVLGRKVS